MSQDVDSKRLKDIATRNTKSTLIAYGIPVLLYSGLVSYLGLTSTPYWVYVCIYLICASFIFGSMLVIRNIRNFTHDLGGPLLFTQLVFWLVLSHIWLFTLEEGRSGGLLFALIMLVYTFAYGTLKVAVVLNTLIVLGFLSVSYVGIHVYGQRGSMMNEFITIAAYLPVSILVGRVGSKLAIRKRHMKELLIKQNKTQEQLTETLIKLEQAASTDELTGLFNRREINRLLAYEYQQIQRHHTTASLIIFDLDNFKLVNDTYGHCCGDKVIQSVANTLKDGFRVTDSVARWGGEEFIVLMPNTHLADAQQVVQRVIATIANTPVHHDEGVLKITVSAGLYELNSSISIKDALHKADEHLYHAKASGRNQLVSRMADLSSVNSAVK